MLVEKRPSRRQFLKYARDGALAYLMGETGILLYTEREAQEVVFRDHQLKTSLLPPDESLCIVHLTDLHIGADGEKFICPSSCQVLAQGITNHLGLLGAESEKTIIINTGDSVCSLGEVESRIGNVVSGLKPLSRIPAEEHILTEGNHDVRYSYSTELWQEAEGMGLLPLGIPGTGNYVLERPLFDVVALPDYTTRQDWYSSENGIAFVRFLEDRDSDRLLLLLTHNPAIIDLWMEGMIEKQLQNALVLAGHTHGGQVYNRFSPGQRLTRRLLLRGFLGYQSRYIVGLEEINKSSLVNVSPGVGHVLGFRTVPPEVDFLFLQGTNNLGLGLAERDSDLCCPGVQTG